MNKRKILIALILFSIALLLFSPAVIRSENLSMGSRGEGVRTVQAKLKRWGYYKGAVDGIYGSGTYAAVRYFQKVNGLKIDGVVGPETAAALGMSVSAPSKANISSSPGSLNLLARLIQGEARGEPYKGKVAVAAVVLNRVKSSRFPNTVAGVIYQRGAFDAVSDGQINLPPDAESLRAARDALNGWDPSNGCLYYYNPATATSLWMLSRPVLLRIGAHSFC